MNFLKALTLVAGTAFAGVSANATVVEFSQPDWVDEGGAAISSDWRVAIDDSPTDGYRFSVSIDAGSTDVGDLLLFGLNTTLDLALATIDLVSSSTGDPITGVCFESKSCGTGGGSFTGGLFNGLPNFDAVIRLGDQGSSSGLNVSFVFDLFMSTPAEELTTSLFSAVAIRAQTIGSAPNGGNDSLKAYNDVPTISTVPVPAAGFLLIGALGGLAALRRKTT